MSSENKNERIDKLMKQIDENLSEGFSTHRHIMACIMELERRFVELAEKVNIARDADKLEGELLKNTEYELGEVKDNIEYILEALYVLELGM